MERPPALDVTIEHLVVRQGTGREITLEELDLATPTAGAAPRYELTATSFGVAGATPEIAPSALRAAVVLAKCRNSRPSWLKATAARVCCQGNSLEIDA